MSNDSKLKYFAYVRKSTEDKERQALSIPTQKEKIIESFSDLDIEFVEETKSAFIPNNRPNFARMIECIEKGERQGLIAWHPDRISRNEKDAGTITYLVRTGIIKDLKFGTYHFENTPEGIWMLQMALSQSQYESAKKGRDVKRGLEKKAKMGHPPYSAVEGYLNTPNREKGFKEWIEDPQRFMLVRRMWDLMLTGNYTPPKILQIANKEWGYKTKRGKNLARSTIYKIFTNPCYYGWFEYPQKNGNWRQGAYKAMITQDEFQKVQLLLGRRGKPAPKIRTFAYTGLIRCGDCGCLITAEEKNQLICTNCKFKFAYENKHSCPHCETLIEKMKKPTILKYTYYHCTKKKKDMKCAQQTSRVEELEKQIDAFLQSIQINQKYLDWALKHLKKSHELESISREAILRSQQKAYNDSSKKLDRLLEMRMTEELTEEEYLAKKSKIIKEREHYKELLQDTEHRQDKWLKLSEYTFNFSRYARFWFADAIEKKDYQKQREILATLGSNLILKDQKLNIEPQEPFFSLKNGLATVPQAQEGFEPKNFRMNKRKRELVSSLNPHWLRW